MQSKRYRFCSIGLLTGVILLTCAHREGKNLSAIINSEFIYNRAEFPSAHASTIVETGGRLAAAWFGGTAEGHPDVGIWISRYNGSTWSAPVQVDSGMQPGGIQYPCWNPVLFQPIRGPLLLFYKVGPNPREWWGMVRTSTDSGRSWSDAAALPEGFIGPIRAKPVELEDGTLIAGSSTEHAGWTVHMERFSGFVRDAGISGERNRQGASLSSAEAWQKTGPLNDPKRFGAIQPAILVHTYDRLQILCRSRQGIITEAWSEDAGLTWGEMSGTSLLNPNAGIDVVKLADGRFLLVYNPVAQGRHELAVAVSGDGHQWQITAVLEDSPGEFSYPAAILASDEKVHVTYTWKRRRIKHVVIDPSLFD